ncbi:MAG: rRNA maturation RNase YbeY [Ginsengibacter sp.]
MKKISFHFKYASFTLRKRKFLKKFLENVIKMEGGKLSKIEIIFCDDEYLLTLNQKFLKHNYHTDILTFDLSISDVIVGEMYLSVPRIRANALTYNSTLKDELHRVLFHGVLHLCGYTDNTNLKRKMMEKLQDGYVLDYNNLLKNVPRGTS